MYRSTEKRPPREEGAGVKDVEEKDTAGPKSGAKRVECPARIWIRRGIEQGGTHAGDTIEARTKRKRVHVGNPEAQMGERGRRRSDERRVDVHARRIEPSVGERGAEIARRTPDIEHARAGGPKDVRHGASPSSVDREHLAPDIWSIGEVGLPADAGGASLSHGARRSPRWDRPARR